jgi:hypothetical protein
MLAVGYLTVKGYVSNRVEKPRLVSEETWGTREVVEKVIALDPLLGFYPSQRMDNTISQAALAVRRYPDTLTGRLEQSSDNSRNVAAYLLTNCKSFGFYVDYWADGGGGIYGDTFTIVVKEIGSSLINDPLLRCIKKNESSWGKDTRPPKWWGEWRIDSYRSDIWISYLDQYNEFLTWLNQYSRMLDASPEKIPETIDELKNFQLHVDALIVRCRNENGISLNLPDPTIEFD